MVDYFFVDSEMHAWDPHDPDDRLPVNADYFRGVFAAMERHLEDEGPPLRVFLTGRVDSLPEYGQDVVVVVIGDECGRPPLYAQDVGITFKCYGTTPQWEAQSLSLRPLSKGRIANSLRNVARSFPYVVWTEAEALKRRMWGKSVSPVYEIPLGYNNQAALPVKPISEREIDVFFAGTIEPQPESLFSIRRWVPPPKTASRREMVREAKKLDRNNPSLECRIEVADSADDSTFMGREEYSSVLMNSKICLVPRGNNVETWRFFEAIRYGCLVVAEPLPNRWYYENSPAIELDRWSKLEVTLKNIMNNQLWVKKTHIKTIKYWNNICSENALTKYMAKKVKNSIICDTKSD
ncbi:hypothetical protein GGP66_000208 [Salinibacter ruber]|uniref:glycosyltransferase family 47 protein n=1 Tax=Salinibacter ruber TaxID=146919 RepID=UPI00216A48F3|nr:glycosyltransferase family 47 protein [Salinibacter ruber]MCS3672804.1 hypothetical protein [Salinibacter ruber]